MNEWLQRIWIQLTADKRRFGALVVVVAVGMLFWARIIIISQPPQRAVADDDPVGVISLNRPARLSPIASDSANSEVRSRSR